MSIGAFAGLAVYCVLLSVDVVLLKRRMAALEGAFSFDITSRALSSQGEKFTQKGGKLDD